MVVLAAGAFIVLVGLIFSFRIMRRGIGSLERSTERMRERIEGEERKIAEDMRNMSSEEHMDVTTAAVRDLLRLTPGREACPVEVEGRRLVLHLPEGEVSLALAMQEASLRSLHKRIQGHAVWQVRGCRRDADFHDVASAMRHLDHILLCNSTHLLYRSLLAEYEKLTGDTTPLLNFSYLTVSDTVYTAAELMRLKILNL